MVYIWTREEYYKKKWDIDVYWKDNCPLCDMENQKSHIVWEWKYWYICLNMFPYSWDEKHLMVIPYEHKIYSVDLIDEELLEYKDVQKFMKNFYADEHYFSCTRESMGHRSIEHLHIHFVPWRLQWKYLRKMLQNQGYPIVQELDINEKKYLK